jgi:hypothetical protein
VKPVNRIIRGEKTLEDERSTVKRIVVSEKDQAYGKPL